jgi:anthranilate synthase component 1
MSSGSGPRATGTDGSDHKFRQRVNTHYTLMAQARDSQARWQRGEALPLDGVPEVCALLAEVKLLETSVLLAAWEEDRALEADLLADQKERAEHLMLLDLGRNDVGRVAKVGTVRPTEQFIIERYSHVMHIVSNVVGRIAEGQDALSALLAGLPAGTVSGAPQVRALQIIDELEPEKRGVYGGGVGYFAANGEMDMCIALRTAVLQDEVLYIQAGGGVVYDSDPDAEYEETVNKSRALRRAAEDAGLFAGRGNG